MSLENTCFIISPIGQNESEARKEADKVLKYIIEPALKDFSITPVRSDKIYESGSISEQMFQYIMESRLCIVLLTGENPNVFYELAVAQCAGRPIILLIKEKERLPFDIKDLRVISYDHTDADRLMEGRDSDELRKHLKNLEENNWETISLFKQYPYGQKLYTEEDVNKKLESDRAKPLTYSEDKKYNIPDNPLCKLRILTGSIEDVSNISVIVNSENIDLQLARFYDPSLSGTLRYFDAEKDDGGYIKVDSLNEKIQEAIKTLRLPVQPGTVVVTETTGLKSKGINYIFHLTLARGEIGGGYNNVPDRLDAGIRNVFEKLIKLHETDNTVSSILFPLIGAGTSKSDPDITAKEMIKLFIRQD